MSEEHEASADRIAKVTAPYTSFATFKNFLAGLRSGGGAPIVIDNSVYGNMSGGVRSQLKAALRFLGLVDEKNKPTEMMHTAVEATQDAAVWSAFVHLILTTYYAPIIAHPLTNTTPAALRKEFEASYSGTPDVITKSITFFIHAAREAGVALSPRLTERQRGGGARRGAPRRRHSEPQSAPPPTGVQTSALGVQTEGIPPTKPRKVHEHQMALIEIINTYTDMDDAMRQALLGAVGFISQKGVVQ